MLNIDYQIMISKLMNNNLINTLDAIEYSNIIENKKSKWVDYIVDKTKYKVECLYNERYYK